MKTVEQDRYGAVDKCRAVLAVWTERKQASILCREMGMSASLFSQWQDRALSGMLEALEPRGTRTGVEGPALSELVKRLLDRKVRARELEVPWAAINTWEKKSLNGMLTALDPTWQQAAEDRPSLPRRVEKLIEQTLKPAATVEPAAN